MPIVSRPLIKAARTAVRIRMFRSTFGCAVKKRRIRFAVFRRLKVLFSKSFSAICTSPFGLMAKPYTRNGEVLGQKHKSLVFCQAVTNVQIFTTVNMRK